MVPKLVNNHDPHVSLRVSYTTETLHHRRFFSSLMCDMVWVTVDSTAEFLFRLAYVLLMCDMVWVTVDSIAEFLFCLAYILLTTPSARN